VATIFLEFVSCKFGNYGKNLEKISKLLKLQNWGGKTEEKKPWCWRALYLVHICKSKFSFTLFGT
jgi:hypothetical protein